MAWRAMVAPMKPSERVLSKRNDGIWRCLLFIGVLRGSSGEGRAGIFGYML